MIDSFINRRIIVIDGHDGAGKSSIAKRVAAQVGGVVVKPFGDSLGDFIAWLWRSEQFEVANQVARLAIRKVLEECPEEKPVVFDRHWLTMFTVLPERFRSSWLPLPSTVLCWTNLETTIARLSLRGESTGDLDVHRYYIQLYSDLATQYSIPIIDTTHTRVEEAASEVLANHPLQ